MLEQQSHLTNWLPIAVPIEKWLIWPPPFGYPPAALGPLGLFLLFFKVYHQCTTTDRHNHVIWAL